jgi:hypothetical protein
VRCPCSQDINPRPTSSRGRQPSREVRHFWLDFKDSNHWLAKGRSRICNVFSSFRSFYFCEDCDVGLCVYPNFTLYRTAWYNMMHATLQVSLRAKRELGQWSHLMCNSCSGYEFLSSKQWLVRKLRFSLCYDTEENKLAPQRITSGILRKIDNHVAGSTCVYTCQTSLLFARYNCVRCQKELTLWIVYFSWYSKGVNSVKNNKFIQLTNAVIPLQPALNSNE